MEQDNEINNAYRKGHKASPASPASPASSTQSTFLAPKDAMPTTGSGPVKRCTGNRFKAAAFPPVSGSRVLRCYPVGGRDASA